MTTTTDPPQDPRDGSWNPEEGTGPAIALVMLVLVSIILPLALGGEQTFGVQALGDHLAARFGLPTVFLDTACPGDPP